VNEWRNHLNDPAAIMAHVQSLVIGDPQPNDHPIFADLGAAHPGEWNLLEVVKIVVVEKPTRLSAYINLFPALAHLKSISAAELVDLLVHLRGQDDGYSWAIVGPLKSLFARSDLGRDALTLAISAEEVGQEEVQLLADLLCRTEGREALSFLESLPGETNMKARTALLGGICALLDIGALDMTAPLSDRLWPLSLLAIEVDRSAFLGWEIACRLLPVHEQARNVVTKAAQEGPQKAHAAIYRWLIIRPERHWPDESCLALVRNMLSAARSDAVVRRTVDSLLAGLSRVKGARASLLSLLDVIFGNDMSGNPKTDFPCVYSTVTSDRSLYSTLLSRLLLGVSVSVPALRELIQHGFLEPTAFVPDAKQFELATPADRTRALHRVLAETVSGPALCNFIYGLGSAEELQPWAAETFLHAFIDHIALEFPQAALDFLNEKATDLDDKHRMIPLVERALDPIARWRAVLLALPKLAELEPSDEKKIALTRRAIREQRQIQKQVREQSVLAKIATPLNVSQGRRVISRSPGRPPGLIEMKTMSHSFEMPGSEAADPLAALTRRMQYLKDEP
jgi:hypothetical protein